jgi:general secretion pathway protein B
VARPRREPVQPPAPDAISEQEALDLELELELKRQLEADQGAEPPIPYAGEDVSADPSPPTPVPSDLIEQIDSFKRQIREGKQGDVPPQAGRVVIKGDPTRLRLSQEQQAGLPDYMMTVHVFDPDKSRRFVLINGLKYGEGDKTREGLIVEQILADGAVLSHRGSPFFVHR